ncbi:MAG TPA: inorganic phosphate transporter [Bacillota bacterium]
MPEPQWLILAVVAAALLFDFTNGWNDAANAVATVVSTRVLSPFAAVSLSALLNVVGAFYSTAVARTIGSDIIDPAVATQQVVLAALIGGITWNTAMTIAGLPISASHALLGGMIGAALVHGGAGALQMEGIRLILIAMILSPAVGLVFGYVFIQVLRRVFGGAPPALVNALFRRLQLLSAGWMSFSHGTNDAQKAMGIMTLALFSGGYIDSIDVPGWVVLVCALAMGVGTMVGGWRVIRTLGMRMLKLEPIHGFAAETGAALVLTFTAGSGVPVSTTHTITGSILGVGASRGFSAVRWGVAGKILYAWLFTLPGSGLVAALSYAIFRALS